jgi:hypothetical protein
MHPPLMRTIGTSALMAAILLGSRTVAVSMNGETIFGTTDDTRVKACGVEISGDGVPVLRPFIEAASDLEGEFTFRTSKQSGSGSGTTAQRSRFMAGSLGTVTVRLETAATVHVVLEVRDHAGKRLCGLDRLIEPGPPTKTKI